MSLSDGKDRVIKSPIDRPYGVVQWCTIFRVWALDECHDPTQWFLKHDRVLKPDDWWDVVGDYQRIRRVKVPGSWTIFMAVQVGEIVSTGTRSDDDDIISTRP
jgi:hypothetical protein